MRTSKTFIIFCFALVFLIFVSVSDAKKKSKKSKGLLLRQKETNAVNFIRLVAMRAIWGVATRIGLGEQISEALGGAFVPPGVDDDYDYGGGGGGGIAGIFNRDEEDDYDY